MSSTAERHGVSYAKVAEYQRRRLIHFHAIFRLDGVDPVHPERTIQPHPAINPAVLASLLRGSGDESLRTASLGHKQPSCWARLPMRSWDSSASTPPRVCPLPLPKGAVISADH